MSSKNYIFVRDGESVKRMPKDANTQRGITSGFFTPVCRKEARWRLAVEPDARQGSKRRAKPDRSSKPRVSIRQLH